MKSSVSLGQHKPLSPLKHSHIELRRKKKKKKVGYLAHITSILRGYPKSKKRLLVGRNRSLLAQMALLKECGLETSQPTRGDVTALLTGKPGFRWKQKRAT